MFETDSDTEVLLAGLTLQGSNFLRKLNGMFAFCFHDLKSHTIIISRDLLGKKPLYFTVDSDTFNFCSSQDALKSIIKSEARNEHGIQDFLSLGYFVDPVTSNAKIQSVNPGEVISISVDTPTNLVRTEVGSFESAKNPTNLRECLISAVKNRITGHDRVAVSLSGGLDSTLVAIILKEIKPDATAFSARWPDSDKSRYNHDSEVASRTARELGLDFNTVEIFKSTQLKQMLNLYLEAMEEPNNNSTGLSMLNLYQSIHQSGFRLALTGDGADEIFGGYSRYSKSEQIPNLLHLKSRRIQERLLTSEKRKFGILLGSQVDPRCISKFLKWHLIFTPQEIALLNPKISAEKITERLIWQLSSSINLNSESTKENFMEFDSRLWLSMESNRRLDRVSMKYSVEARSPFQDETVRMIAKKLIRDEPRRTSKRDFMVKAFPELAGFNLQKEKVGFISPIGHWLRGNRELITESLDFLVLKEHFSRQAIDYFRGAPDRGNFSELTKLWTLLVFAQWSMNHEK